MIKPIVVLVVSALLVTVALAEEKTKEQCVEESVNILSTISVSQDVKDLLNITHGFYSNLKKIIAAPEPSPEFIQALENVTYPHGCRKIYEDLGKLDRCFDHFNDPEERFVLEIVDHKPETEELFEADNVCEALLNIREQKVRRECAEKGARILSEVRVDESVMKLVEISRESYSNLEEIIEEPEPSPKYKQAMTNANYPDGCRKIDEGLKKIGYCYQYFLEKDDRFMLDIVGRAPETEKIFEANYACEAAKSVPIHRV